MSANARYVGSPTQCNLRALNHDPHYSSLDELVHDAVQATNKKLKQPVQRSQELRGGSSITWIASPEDCSSPSELSGLVEQLAKLGIKYIRADLKRLPAPTALRGPSRLEKLQFISRIAAQYKLKVVSELTNNKDLEDMLRYVDIVELNSRSVKRGKVLDRLGETGKTILLHRCSSTSVATFLKQLKLIDEAGIRHVVLVEDALRKTPGRNQQLLDIASIIALKRNLNFPIIVDCKSASKDPQLMQTLAVAVIAAGADGLIVDLAASSSGRETLRSAELWSIIRNMRALKSTFNALSQFNVFKQAENTQ